MEKQKKRANHGHVAHHKKTDSFNSLTLYLMIAVAILVVYNQSQLSSINKGLDSGTAGFVSGSAVTRTPALAGKDVSDVDLDSLKGTGFSIAALFPVEEISTAQDAIDMMVPTGMPDYGEEMGVSFDDPVGSLEKLAKAQRALLAGLSAEEKERFINLAIKPVGISCEYCCGIGPSGIRSDGSSACGCQHNPALLSVTMWLMQNTDYTDAEILKEVLKWKTLFFPKNMIELAMEVAGGDTSSLAELPGMVGGC